MVQSTSTGSLTKTFQDLLQCFVTINKQIMERKIIYSCKRGISIGKFTVDLQETTKRVVTNLFMTVSPV